MVNRMEFQFALTQPSLVTHRPRQKVPIPPAPSITVKNHNAVTRQNPQQVSTSVVKKKRKSAPKSRGGCITCRIRHEKCDQTKPACTKCTSTKRTCDYLQSIPKKSPGPNLEVSSVTSSSLSRTTARALIRTTSSPSSPLPNFELNETDAHFFRYLIQAECAGFFSDSGSPTWLLILQVAQTEETIRLACLSMSMLHNLYHVVKDSKDKTAEPVHTSIYNGALSKYHKAVAQLRKRLTQAGDPPDLGTWEVSILASFLFTALEMLIGNENGAYHQCMNGFSLMKNALNNYRKNPSQIDLPGNLKTLALAMNRRDIQATTFGYGWIAQTIMPAYVPDTFLSWADAETSIETIHPNILGLIRLTPWCTHTHPQGTFDEIAAQRKIRQDDLKMRLAQWLAAFQKWVAFRQLANIATAASAAQLTKEKVIHNRLIIQYWIGYIWLHTPFSPSQTVHDQYLEQYRLIVELAEEILELKPEKREEYSSEQDIIQPLFYTIQKCRDGNLRRHALSLLSRSGREGVWEGHYTGAAARWIMEHEEENLGGDLVGSVVRGEEGFIEDKWRFRSTYLHGNRTERKLFLLSSRRGPNGEEIWIKGTVNWGEEDEARKGVEWIYGDKDMAWHNAFLFE